jgi:hypothetical protein
MTPAASDEILTALNTEGERTRGGEKGERERAQDDELKAPSPPQSGTGRTRRGIVKFIPPLRRD